MLNFACTGGSYDRDGNRLAYMFDQLNIEAAIGTVLINAV
jgi:hypothetical protein